MSLFTTREWWGATPGANEEFGGECLAVGNLDNAADGAAKVATGSFAGLLRLYYPRQPEYRVEDLMVESMLDAPILQLDAGQFLSDSNRITLAVLHPRSIAVYSVSAVAGSKELGNQGQPSYFKLTKAFEHALERPACNFARGTFGGGYGHEQICIQSMDGVLTVVEQERILFERKLTKFLLPGPLTYCAKADLLLTYSSRMEVECYKYSTIAAGGGAGGGGGGGAGGGGGGGGSGGGSSAAAKIVADWSLIVGEEVVSIVVGRLSRGLSASSVDVLLVAAHTLIACKADTGAIRTQKRIDYAPLCATTYPSRSQEAGSADENVLIATQGGVVLESSA